MNSVTIKTEKGLVKKLRAIRDKMNEDMQDMTFEELSQELSALRTRGEIKRFAKKMDVEKEVRKIIKILEKR